MRYSISSISPWMLFQIVIFPASTSWAFQTSLHLFAHNRWGPLLLHQTSNLSLHTTTTTKTTSLSSSPEASIASSDDIKTADVLSLDSIRSTLIRQEETIIFALIERAQFRRNDIVYQSGGFGDLGLPLGSSVQSVPTHNKDISHDKHYPQVPLSFLEYMLIGTEVLHCGVRRYTSPEEHPFFPDCLPQGPLAALPKLDYPPLLSSIRDASSINFNPILLKKYREWIVPLVTQLGDDEQHGSTVLADINVLQALSKRVHYGKFVAESKYQSDPMKYQTLVDAGDAQGVMDQLTNVKVEEKVLKRARLKAATYGREPVVEEDLILQKQQQGDNKHTNSPNAGTVGGTNTSEQGKVDPLVIERIYRDFIIPLTKDIEVAYLFRRCGRTPPEQYSPHRMSNDIQ